MPRFGLIVVGDEILSGKRKDKHVERVIGLLGARGLRLSWAHYAGDDRSALADLLRGTFAGEAAVFSCGGIGATPDDHTRQAAAAALGLPLELHPEARELIAEVCAQRGEPDMTTPENRQRLKMGEFPIGARIIPNPFNKIPGFAIERHYFVPGFPVMAWPMIEAVLERDFSASFGADAFEERSIFVYGLPESAVVPLMEEIERRFAPVKAFSLPSVGDGADGMPQRRHIELGVKGGAASIDEAFATLRAGVERLGAEFTLAAAVPRQS